MRRQLRQLLKEADASSEADAYMVARTAKTLADLLEVPVLDKDGRPIAVSVELPDAKQ